MEREKEKELEARGERKKDNRWKKAWRGNKDKV
jgi:hypothetical protein